MGENSITKQQSYFVAKSNEIIQKSRFSMTLQQQKMMLFLISKIKPEDEAGQCYSTSIREFCAVCNIDKGSGKNHQRIKDALKVIADKSMWLKKEDGTEVLLRWIDRLIVEPKGQKITVRFHEDMFPYLLNLRERYTQYSLEYILPMGSKYGIRLYELLRSYANMDSIITLKLADLRAKIDCDKYERFPDFRRFALDPAIEDINKYSDLKVSYSVKHNHARAIEEIQFFISPYLTILEAAERRMNRWKDDD